MVFLMGRQKVQACVLEAIGALDLFSMDRSLATHNQLAILVVDHLLLGHLQKCPNFSVATVEQTRGQRHIGRKHLPEGMRVA